MTVKFEKPRDIVFDTLCETYLPEEAGKGWWHVSGQGFTVDLIKATTVDILSQIVYADRAPVGDERREYEQRTLVNNIRNIIWINFPGGTTAEHTAELIALRLGIDTKE